MILEVKDAGSGPVLVLIHGFPLDHSMWRAQLAGLATRFRLILPNLRGIGLSPTSAGVFTIDALADDVIDTLDSLHITSPVVLGGLSMGGYVAFSIAIRHPARVRGLILINTRAIADTPEVAAARKTMALALDTAATPIAAVDAMMPKLFAHDAPASRVAAVRAESLKLNPKSLASIVRGLAARPSRVDDLPRIAVPTLVLAGSDDQIVPLEEATAMSKAISGGRLVVIPKAGHLAPMENPGAVNDAIAAFIQKDILSLTQ